MGRDIALRSVTVVIPVWDDYVRFLDEAVESVHPDASIIVVDNASSTPIPELERGIVVRSPERLSIGAARNLGIERVETPFVLSLDADDKLLPGALEFMVSKLESDPSISICATSIMEAETWQRHRTPRRFVARLARRPAAFAFADSVWSLLPIGCAVLRTDQVRDAGGYADADWGEDWVLATSLTFRGRVELDQRFGRYYRYTENSLSESAMRQSELMPSARRVRERIRTDRGIPGWARTALPLIAVLQLAAIWTLRPAYQLMGRSARG